MTTIQRKTWAEFRETKLLWWVNRSLHLFGWSICIDGDGTAFPAKVPYTGFPEEVEQEGFSILRDKFIK